MYESQRNRFQHFSQRDDHKFEMYQIAKRMVKTKEDVTGEYCISNGDGMLAVMKVMKSEEA